MEHCWNFLLNPSKLDNSLQLDFIEGNGLPNDQFVYDNQEILCSGNELNDSNEFLPTLRSQRFSADFHENYANEIENLKV